MSLKVIPIYDTPKTRFPGRCRKEKYYSAIRKLNLDRWVDNNQLQENQARPLPAPAATCHPCAKRTKLIPKSPDVPPPEDRRRTLRSYRALKQLNNQIPKKTKQLPKKQQVPLCTPKPNGEIWESRPYVRKPTPYLRNVVYDSFETLYKDPNSKEAGKRVRFDLIVEHIQINYRNVLDKDTLRHLHYDVRATLVRLCEAGKLRMQSE